MDALPARVHAEVLAQEATSEDEPVPHQ